MRINEEECNGCGKCIPFCSVDAILKSDKKCWVDQEKCVECYVCLNSGICPIDAIEQVQLTWPRIIRHTFSSVIAAHKITGWDGRGTVEMKTNDVTGRYRLGEVGFTVDVGRPGVGTSFEDVEKIAMAVAKLGVAFEPVNPITKLMTDTLTGSFRDDVKKERILSCILEFKTKESQMLPVIEALKEVAKSLNTVFCVGCISRCRPDGTIPIKPILDDAGIYNRPNGKINLGLGRPLAL